MTAAEVVELIERFAAERARSGPHGTNVTSVRRVATTATGSRPSHGEIQARTVVIASGACNLPTVPAFADAVPADVEQLTPFDYRNPDQLPDGGVLVVGASATGVQLAAELRRSGRPVTLSVGEHVRLPRIVSRPRRAVVDGRVRRVGPALRRGRGPHASAAAAVAAARRDARARDARPQRARGDGRRAGRSLGVGPRRPSRCSPAACATSARSRT